MLKNTILALVALTALVGLGGFAKLILKHKLES
jgi:hypothetical protein